MSKQSIRYLGWCMSALFAMALLPAMSWAATPINLILEQGHMQNPNPVAQTCNDFRHLITINQFVENNDTRPLPANQYSMYVTEKGGAHLRSKSYPIPAITPGAHTNMKMAVGSVKSYRAHLPGLHMLYIHLVANGKEISSYPILVEFPKDFCQLRSRLSPSRMHMQATAQIAPPKLRLIRETHSVDTSCANMNRLVTFNVQLRNDGGPLAAHKLEVWVEDDKLVLPYDGVNQEKWMPAIMPGGTATVTLPIAVLQRNIGQLPGAHSVALRFYTSTALQNGMRTIATKHITIILPQGICQPKLHMRSPTGMRMQPKPAIHAPSRPSPKLNPQPEPPSAVHRLSLPAVQ